MKLEELKKQLSEKLRIATPWVYLTIIPVVVLGFILSIFVMSWRFANLIADVVDAWHLDRLENK